VSAQSLYKWIKADSPDASNQLEAELREVHRGNLCNKKLCISRTRTCIIQPPENHNLN